MSHWSFAAPSLVLLLGSVIVIAAGWICWTIWQRTGRRKAVGGLEALRLLLITLLGFTLLRPEFVRQLQRTDRPEVLVLCDGSSSMRTRDILSSNGVVSRADWLSQQRAKRFWKPVEQAAKVTIEDFALPPSRTNSKAGKAIEGTDLNQAMEGALQRQRNLKALLLLTDGDWNLGKSPVGTATRYRELGIPIFAVAVGRETPVPDLILESVSPPSFGLFGEQISIPFKVQNNLKREVRTTIALLCQDSREIMSRHLSARET
jgi:hypothetical protein